jgi:extradiol dioxygenase family protein
LSWVNVSYSAQYFYIANILNFALINLLSLKTTVKTNIRVSMSTIQPFHLAFPVNDLAAARSFYGNTLGCPEGRSSDEWIDFDFFGHQLVAHLAPEECGHASSNEVDGHQVPVKHFGVVLTMPDWHALAEKLTHSGIKFIIEPQIRFKGMVGEQATMFFLDPAGNALEFKAFEDPSQLFAK